MSVTDLSFAAALQRLGDIRRDLADVADPDVVDSLEQEASALAEHCRMLLRRPRPLRARQQQVLPTEDEVSGPAPFDQFQTEPTEAPADPGRPSEDATVSIPTGDKPSTDTPDEQRTEQLPRVTESSTDQAPQRTIVLPGDAPTGPIIGATEDDDTSTSILRGPR